MKCIQTENSDVHSMYYGSLHFILVWGIVGNSPIFPEHIYFLNPRPVPTVSEKTLLVPVPEYWGFSGRGTICPQNGFPSPPRNSPKHFHKALPIPAPSPKLGEGDGFPQVSRPRLASLHPTVHISCIRISDNISKKWSTSENGTRLKVMEITNEEITNKKVSPSDRVFVIVV